MSDLPKRPKAPGSTKTFITKAFGALCMASGTINVAVGAIALASPKTLGAHNVNKQQSALLVISGLIGGFIGKSFWDVGQFTKLTREANRVDELLLERASINKEIEQHQR